MYTDEQLTNSLSAAFHADADNLTYRGPVPAPSSLPRVAAPVALTAAVGVGVAVAATLGTHHDDQRHSAALRGAQHHRVTTPATTVVEKHVRLAGYTFTYHQAAGDAPLYAEFVDRIPTGATPVQTPASTTAYVGIDPQTGDHAAFVLTEYSNVLEITSADATESELVAMLQSHEPRAIPVVGGNGD